MRPVLTGCAKFPVPIEPPILRREKDIIRRPQSISGYNSLNFRNDRRGAYLALAVKPNAPHLRRNGSVSR
ncbi:hypothetical protein IE4872_CH01285 [Rhizobium gallicum]|uniref:Uncharacterized protein n=1 Tax=Rhizobium gallicum TaxID=56730 RepID=A0A1L5NGF2_9HYPH|nr:hypothetical protein IE4872_CH01285 [Rhizobium gallicum]